MIPHHKCHICHKETSDCLLTDIANYSSQTGNLAMVSRVVCSRCREQITTIRQYVEENQLSFGKNSGIYYQTVQKFIHGDRDQQEYPTIYQYSQIYQKTIQQQIKRNKLYHCAKLPQNCLQLVYYSSLTINHAERHQRIRNTIGQVMKISPIPYANLQDIAILVHCLSCYMHQDNVVKLMKVICQREILEGIPIKQEEESQEKDQKEDLGGNIGIGILWRQLYRKCYIGNILIIIAQLLRDWKNFENYFQKLRQFHGYIKKQQFTKIISVSQQISSPLRKSHSVEQNRQQQLSNHQTNCKQCNNSRKQSLLSQARFKNILALTLKSLIRQDAAHREHVAQLQIKFTKQKQQFINKIIKLKDKIEVLQHTDQNGQSEIMIRRARSVSDCHGKKSYYKPDLQSVSQKSQGTSKTIQMKQKNQEGQNVKTTFDTDKSKQNQSNLNGNDQARKNSNQINNNIALEYLQKLATNIPQFDPSMLSPEADPKLLLQAVQNSLKTMRTQLQKLQKKTKTFQNQSKRLLTILTRKQERFVPLIHEKDEIIEKYENALWRMQRGLIVQDPALSTRIANIINVFRNDFMESLSNGTLQSDINYEEITKTPPSKNKTTSKKKNKEKEKEKDKQKGSQKTQKKIKSEDKDKQCMIF